MAPAQHFLEYVEPRACRACVARLFLFLHNMSYRLSDLAIRAILKEWNLQTYLPPYTDVREWIRSIDLHCNLYGIPDAQWRQCADNFINAELRIVLTVLGSLDWNQFKAVLIPIDRK
jgi:hypothetical protein